MVGRALKEGGARGTNSLRAMQHAHDLPDVIRPWRRATIAVSAVAALELVALAAIALVVFGNPLGNHLRETAAAASTPRIRTAQPAPAKKPELARDETSVMVLNGGGQSRARLTPPPTRSPPTATCSARSATRPAPPPGR